MFLTFVFILLELSGRFGNGLPIEKLWDTSRLLNQRIIGGVDAPDGHSPYMVALISAGFFEMVTCGGSIISERIVLTAAHCIDPFILFDGTLMESFQGRVGSNQWNSGGSIVKFKDYKNHPDYDPFYIKNDIGMLYLTEQLNFNERVGIISLGFDWVGGQEEAFVAGWGIVGPRIEDNVVDLAPTPDNLQLLYVTTMTHEECSKAIREASLILGEAPPVDPVGELCAFHSVGHGMCNGDSGSAMVMKKEYGIKKFLRVVGIVSWGFPCAVGVPDVYVRVSGYEGFLSPLLNHRSEE